MTENRSAEIVEVSQPDLDRPGWGARTEISTMSKRLSAMLPGVRNEREGQRLAQASILSRANPFRGEMYVFGDQIIEGYKLLVRWAKRQEDYTAKYIKLAPDDPNMLQVRESEIGYVCEIWRDSVRSGLVEACKAGIPYEAALEMFIPERAVGIVSRKDTYSARKKSNIDPPTGWSWDQVAKKRALKNALNIAYGMPSPDELVKESWEVDGQATRFEDWQGTQELNPGDAAALAKDRARHREHQERLTDDPEYKAEFDVTVKAAESLMYPAPEHEPQAVDGEFTEMPQEPEPTPDPDSESGDAWNDEIIREAKAIGVGIRKAAGWTINGGWHRAEAEFIGDSQQSRMLAGVISKALRGVPGVDKDKPHHVLISWLFNAEGGSTKNLTDQEAGVSLARWTGADGDKFTPTETAIQEIRTLFQGAQLLSGQQRLPLVVRNC